MIITGVPLKGHRAISYRKLCTGLTVAMLSSPVAANGTLIVHFTGIKNNQGTIVCSLTDSSEHFLSRDQAPKRSCQAAITESKATWKIEQLAYGRYAISAFHDENDNGELDSGIFGIPSEDYGFSNDARGSFGPPDYEEAEFEFHETDQVISIRIK